MEHYKPLAQGLTIKPSEINGLGLHTLNPLKAGTYLGETHVWHEKRHEWIRTPLGGFINHSSSPNCFIYTTLESRELFVVKPIEKGEELTAYYTVGYDDIL